MKKKYLFIILIFFILFFLIINPTKVEGLTDEIDRYVRRDVKVVTDRITGATRLDYKFFTDDGYHEGSINLFDWNEQMVVYNSEDGKIYTIRGSKSYPMYIWSTGDVFCTTFQYSSAYYTYDFETKEWVNKKDVARGDRIYGHFYPNSILYVRGIQVKYSDNSTPWNGHTIDYQFLQNNQMFMKPQIEYEVANGFKLWLHDFHDGAFSGNPTYKEVLGHVYVSAYDYLTSTYKLERINALEYVNVQEQNVEGTLGYYIELFFNGVLSSLSNTDGDYLITITTDMKSTIYHNGVDNFTGVKAFRFNTLYQSNIYGRFKYNALTHVGSFNPSDSEGNPIEGGTGGGETPIEPPSQDDKVSSAIDNQTQKIEEQTNAINNQTEAIKENNETNKNIFQKLLDLPGLIIDGFLNMLKSIFIPSEDFFTNWLNDLNEYFGDTFGILYYPFEILIDFLNRVSTISETGTAILNIPEFKLNFFGNSITVFSAYSFNFNDILTEDIYKNIHNIYLTIVDVILWLGVIYLANKLLHTIFGGLRDDDIANLTSSDEVDYGSASVKGTPYYGSVSVKSTHKSKHMK